MNLYFLSGLGVDYRIFKNLTLPDKFSLHYIDWIRPIPHEPIAEYAKRLCGFVDQSKPFALIGLSFGGMMAVEMSRFINPLKIILISSAATRFELPWFVKLVRFLPVYKIMPIHFLKKFNWIHHYVFGIKTQEEKELLHEILKDTDPVLIKWSIDTVCHWSNRITPSNMIHIHGKADKLLPIKFTKTDIAVEGGEHFMIYTKATEISEILNRVLAQPQL